MGGKLRTSDRYNHCTGNTDKFCCESLSFVARITVRSHVWYYRIELPLVLLLHLLML